MMQTKQSQQERLAHWREHWHEQQIDRFIAGRITTMTIAAAVRHADKNGYEYLICACGNIETNQLYFSYWDITNSDNVKCPGCSGLI